VRYSHITASFLILLFATSAFGCATGAGSEPLGSCHRPRVEQACLHSYSSVTVAKASGCRDRLKSSLGQCSLRSLAQFQFAELRSLDTPSPPQLAIGKTSPLFNSNIIVSSIGSPETDRGPPRS